MIEMYCLHRGAFFFLSLELRFSFRDAEQEDIISASHLPSLGTRCQEAKTPRKWEANKRGADAWPALLISLLPASPISDS